ncbi:ABC transporter substrate-binding protein [Hyphomicrobium sp. D-2]|uniref:ABC transporter substrate-binding protein n=1 Tax=Hyphomicrobium sp. D-2 TaxID=3041621 RepID=UPI002457B7D9|nr:ABC transporter substrate-binding protein [Hyphomicrobium sp. D-2]MDH4981941.1 ABC transporter substrate-binding protein [Hyphomicrobium sp. D-2]
MGMRLLAVAAVMGVCSVHVMAVPKRVVSMNLCTDQLAMLMADEGQLVSVSHLASDPASSVMVTQAQRYAVNHGLAEEIFVMAPDMVFAGTYTSRASVAMLKRLGFRVEQFEPASSFEDIEKHILRMGELLGRPQRAKELIAEFHRRLAEARGGEALKRPLSALHYANSYTSGAGTLAAEVVDAAGLRNLGSELGLTGTSRLPLETIIISNPDIIAGERLAGEAPALAYETFQHPALKAILGGEPMTGVADKYWVCGGPFTAEAVAILNAARRKVVGQAHP